ncbi:sodium-dependent dopamine transporter-like [Haemaphysalis longicornis]
MFLSGFPTVTQAGAYVVKLLEDHTVKAVMAHFVPIIEITVVMYIYGMRRFSFDVEFMLGRAPNIYYRICWTIICPIGMTLAYAHRVVTYRSPVYFEASVPNEYKALAWIVGCAGLLQIPIGAMACILENIRFPLRAFQPEYQWEPNTVNRVNAYFEEIEERGIQAAEQVSAEVQGVLYDATEALDISFDPNEPLAFQPKV